MAAACGVRASGQCTQHPFSGEANRLEEQLADVRKHATIRKDLPLQPPAALGPVDRGRAAIVHRLVLGQPAQYVSPHVHVYGECRCFRRGRSVRRKTVFDGRASELALPGVDLDHELRRLQAEVWQCTVVPDGRRPRAHSSRAPLLRRAEGIRRADIV
jgi:hypothetical protein